MYDMKIHENEDGEPVLTVTLTNADVSTIYSALHQSTKEHTKRVFEMVEVGHHKKHPEYRGIEGQAESNQRLGEWGAIQSLLGDAWWEWAKPYMVEDEDEEISA